MEFTRRNFLNFAEFPEPFLPRELRNTMKSRAAIRILLVRGNCLSFYILKVQFAICRELIGGIETHDCPLTQGFGYWVTGVGSYSTPF